MSDKPVIGIDLGTSTSEIALFRDNRPELLQDAQGDRIIPSVVQLQPDGQLVVGSMAKRTSVAYADRTILEVKRLMGTDATITLGDKTLTPPEVSAIILKHLKKAAEEKLGVGSVTDVVISVPARFQNPAREATKQAAELAGLNVLRLINEPTAAALSYGLDRLNDEQKVMVFDFGGGTLDVTILEMFEGVLDVKTSVGDDKLGGKDVDQLLIDFFKQKFQEQRGFAIPDSDKRAQQTLKQFAEEYKKQLSFVYSVQVDIPYLSPQGGIEMVTLSRTDFEKMLQPLVTRALALVDEALQRAKLTYADIDVILPVGGSSRIPIFRNRLQSAWGKELREYDNPDEAVALGAAIAAGLESGDSNIGKDGGIMILDNSPHRLGVAAVVEVSRGQHIEDYFSEIIHKDEKLPAIKAEEYATLYDNQDSLLIRIYEATSESHLCKDHTLIGELPVENLPTVKAGEPFTIEFRYNNNGMLEVSAYLRNYPSRKVDGRFHVYGATPNAEQMKANLDELWGNSEDMKRAMPILNKAEEIQNTKPQHAEQVRSMANALRNALMSGNKVEIDAKIEQLTDLLYDLS